MSVEAEKLIRDALDKLVKQQESAGAKTSTAKLDAFEALLHEVSAALSDVVAAMEDGKGADVAEAITQGLRAMRIEAPSVTVSAPNVTVTPQIEVNVSPTPIINHFSAPEIRPLIHVIEHKDEKQSATFDVAINYAHGLPVGMTITRK